MLRSSELYNSIPVELERRILEIRPKFVFSDIPAATHVKNINIRNGLLIQVRHVLP